jgi:alpha-D-ribose 1-methylphosphonate 5-triphosphate synthase subunit PhnL
MALSRPDKAGNTAGPGPRPMLELAGVGKNFLMHLQGGLLLPVVANVSFRIAAGECVALVGPSGIGKSSLLKMIYGNYRCDCGSIRLADGDGFLDIVQATPRQILRIRQHRLAYVSQFLRVIPRVSALDIVASAANLPQAEARRSAVLMLERLAIAPRLWPLPPATFSGGEQQRINIARSFVGNHPILLLDEPTASLDPANREAVVALIAERKQAGCAILAICHDDDVRGKIADRLVDVGVFAAPLNEGSGE